MLMLFFLFLKSYVQPRITKRVRRIRTAVIARLGSRSPETGNSRVSLASSRLQSFQLPLWTRPRRRTRSRRRGRPRRFRRSCCRARCSRGRSGCCSCGCCCGSCRCGRGRLSAVEVAVAVGVGVNVAVAVGVGEGDPHGPARRLLSTTLVSPVTPSNPVTTMSRFPIAVPPVNECATFVLALPSSYR